MQERTWEVIGLINLGFIWTMGLASPRISWGNGYIWGKRGFQLTQSRGCDQESTPTHTSRYSRAGKMDQKGSILLYLLEMVSVVLTPVNLAGRHITILTKKLKKRLQTQMEFNLCCSNVLLYNLTRARGGTKTLVSSSVFLGSGGQFQHRSPPPSSLLLMCKLQDSLKYDST